MLFSNQAIILTVCNVVILVAVLISMFILKKSVDLNEGKVKTIIKNISALVFFLVIMVIQVYSLNCMVYGDCNTWSWVITAFAIFGTLGYIGFFAYISMSSKVVKDSVKDIMKPVAATGVAVIAPPNV